MIPIWDNAIALIKDAMDRFIPDKTQAAQAKQALDTLRQQQEAQEFLAAADIVKAEAQSEGWLTRSWRPLTMLTFVFLIVCRIFGWTSEYVSEAEYTALWDLVKVGLGGYVIGRSVTQTVQAVAPAISSALRK